MIREELNKLRIGEVVEVRGNHKYVEMIGVVRDINRPHGECEVEFPGAQTISISYKLLRKLDDVERSTIMIDDKEVVKEEISNVEDIDYNSYVTRVAINQPEPYKTEQAKYEDIMNEYFDEKVLFLERVKENLFRERDLEEAAFDARVELLNDMIADANHEKLYIATKIRGEKYE